MRSQAAAGLLRPSARVVAAGEPRRVHVDLDLGSHRFLRDHLVGSRPLLSTVMGIETIASAALLACRDPAIAGITDLVVGPPYLLRPPGRGRVDVTMNGGPRLRCALSADGGTEHFAADLLFGDPPPKPAGREVPVRRRSDPHVAADRVYALYFHGPSFRVVDSAHFSDGIMVGRLAPYLPPLVDVPTASAVAPLLIELCLQTAGLWELAVLGRMMIPDGIDRVTRYTNADAGDGIAMTALVVPRLTSAGRYVFDAQVVDDSGSVQLEVHGYRTTEFSQPFDRSAATAIRERLHGIATP